MNNREIETIKLSEFGSSLGTRELGRKIREDVLSRVREQKRVLVNFKGVHIISSAFADEIFGKLFIDLKDSKFKESIKINGFDNEEDKNLILLIIQKAIDFRKSNQDG